MDLIVVWVLAVLAAAVFVKNAWVTDDAYIIFRSLEQFIAGNGPRWNPHERVQAFTSPLWFGYLALFRTVSPDVFLNAIVASALSMLGMFVVLGRILTRRVLWAGAAALFVSSIGFFDFTTSGLENPLAYLMLTVFLWKYCYDATNAREQAMQLRWLLVVAGIVVLVRHDLATLVMSPLVYACFLHRRVFSAPRWVAEAFLAMLPLLLWTGFAIVYYGFPFPNTAYAKLDAGIARDALFLQGLKYLAVCARYDPVTVLALALGIGFLFRSGSRAFMALAWGLLLNLAYVVWIGGDFMLGRFLSFGFLVAVVASGRVIVERNEPHARRIGYIVVAACVLSWAFVPGNPVRTESGYRPEIPYPAGIVHERGAYPAASLAAYLRRESDVFPQGLWSEEGRDLAESESCCAIRKSTGYYGYWAGTTKRIIDRNALSDPFLSRLPVFDRKSWRIGHFERGLPPGYVESVRDLSNEIADPRLQRLYERVSLVTRSDTLFSRERFTAIVELNRGRSMDFRR